MKRYIRSATTVTEDLVIDRDFDTHANPYVILIKDFNDERMELLHRDRELKINLIIKDMDTFVEWASNLYSRDSIDELVYYINHELTPTSKKMAKKALQDHAPFYVVNVDKNVLQDAMDVFHSISLEGIQNGLLPKCFDIKPSGKFRFDYIVPKKFRQSEEYLANFDAIVEWLESIPAIYSVKVGQYTVDDVSFCYMSWKKGEYNTTSAIPFPRLYKF